jgi:hypothetical protein
MICIETCVESDVFVAGTEEGKILAAIAMKRRPGKRG